MKIGDWIRLCGRGARTRRCKIQSHSYFRKHDIFATSSFFKVWSPSSPARPLVRATRLNFNDLVLDSDYTALFDAIQLSIIIEAICSREEPQNGSVEKVTRTKCYPCLLGYGNEACWRLHILRQKIHKPGERNKRRDPNWMCNVWNFGWIRTWETTQTIPP